jgi:hypothetical protein
MSKKILSIYFLFSCLVSTLWCESPAHQNKNEIVYDEWCYDTIKENLFDKYNRDFTVLHIGKGSEGLLWMSIAQDYDATSVLIEHEYHSPLKELLSDLRVVTFDNLILLGKKVEREDFYGLGLCEHFDVTLALDVIDRFGTNWLGVTEEILNLGDHMVFQVVERCFQNQSVQKRDNSDDQFYYEQNKHLESFIVAHGAQLLSVYEDKANDRKIKLYLVTKNRNILAITYWRHYKNQKRFKGKFKISSDFTRKVLYKKQLDQSKPWNRGINLYTFKMLHGVYPTNAQIRSEMSAFSYVKHSDVKVGNMIIQGKGGVHLIDFGDFRAGRYSPRLKKKQLKAALKMFEGVNSDWFFGQRELIRRLNMIHRKQRRIRNLTKMLRF